MRFSEIRKNNWLGHCSEVPEIYATNQAQKNAIELVLALGYILVTIVLLILLSHRSSGYAIDIYEILPISMFFALIVCYAAGSLSIIAGNRIHKQIGTMLLILTYAAILAIPYMLGYYSMGRADDISYIGEYIQISSSGYIANWDVYPASHIIGALVSLVTGLEPHIVSFIIPFVFSFLFAGGLVLLSRYFLKDPVLVNIAIPSAFILYLGPYNFLNVPHGLFFGLMPLVIFVIARYIENHSLKNIFLLLPISILIPFTHPYLVLFVVYMLGVFIALGRFFFRDVDVAYSRAIYPLSLIALGFTFWFSYSYRLLGTFNRSFLSALEGPKETVLSQTADKFFRINIDIFDSIKLMAFYYGRYAIPILVIIITFGLIFFRLRTVSQKVRRCFIILSIIYVVLIILELLIFFNPIIIHQPDRLTNLNFIVYAQVPLFALSLYILSDKPKSFYKNTALLVLILTGTWGLSLFGTLYSPNVFRANSALAVNEVEGMQWFYEERVTDTVFVPLSQVGRFHTVLGDFGEDTIVSLSDHFGYGPPPMSFVDSNKGMDLKGNVVLLTIDELLYQQVPGYIEVGRYVATDFIRFRNDNSLIGKTYDTTDVEIHLVKQ